MLDNVITDETGRPIWKVKDELSEGDYVIVQTPAVVDENDMPTVRVVLEQIRDIDGDFVYLSKSGRTQKFRITYVVRNRKPVAYSGYDHIRMIQEDNDACL